MHSNNRTVILLALFFMKSQIGNKRDIKILLNHFLILRESPGKNIYQQNISLPFNGFPAQDFCVCVSASYWNANLSQRCSTSSALIEIACPHLFIQLEIDPLRKASSYNFSPSAHYSKKCEVELINKFQDSEYFSCSGIVSYCRSSVTLKMEFRNHTTFLLRFQNRI